MKRQSPIRRVCEPGVFDDIKICKWVCNGDDLKVAQFRSTSRPDWFAVVHPSTKERGKWQVSDFDDRGAIGDVIRKSCTEAINDAGMEYGFKLEHVVSKSQGPLAGLRRRSR